MAIDNIKKSSRLLQSRRYTHDNFTDSQEAFTSTLDINANEVYVDQNLIPSSGLPYSGSSQNGSIYSVGSQSVMKYHYRIPMTRSNLVSGSANEVWFFLIPSGSNSGIGAQLIDSNQQTNFISPKYSVPALTNATTEDATPGYGVKVFVSTNATTPAAGDQVSVNNYTFDYKTGVLQFTTNALSATTSQYVYISAYQYVGRVLKDTLSRLPSTGSNTFTANQIISGTLYVSSSFSASLQNGYAWVGDANGMSRAVATSSFVTPAAAGTISSSAQVDITQTTGYTAFSQSLSGTDASQSVSILIASQSAVGAFQSASAYSSSAATVDLGQTLRLNSIESFTASISTTNTFTQSANLRLNALETSSASVVARVGSVEVFTSSIAATNTFTASILGTNVFTASIAGTNAFTQSVNLRINALETSSASVISRVSAIESFTSSFSASNFQTDATQSARLNSLETFTSSIAATNTFTASIASTNVFTQSVGLRLNALETSSASVVARVGSIESFTASIAGINVFTQSVSSSLTSLNSKTGSYATTGSNTFQGNQTINGTLNVTNIVVTTITASTEYASGSTRFGSNNSNTHEFTGSVGISGSLTIPNLSTGSIIFVGNSGVLQQNNTNFFWDNTNGRLGIGTNTPRTNKFLDILYNVPTAGGAGFGVRNSNASGYSELVFDNDTTPDANGAFVFGYGGTTTVNPNHAYFWNRRNAPILFGTNGLERVRITGAGRLLLGTFTEGTFLLDVNGTARVNGNSEITGSLNVTQGITGSLFGTASWATNTISSSYPFRVTASLNASIYSSEAGERTNNDYSYFIGYKAGLSASNATYATYIGDYAGAIDNGRPSYTHAGVMIGSDAGYNANNSFLGVYLGNRAGMNATNASASVFIGTQAGESGSGASFSVMVGPTAGYFASGAKESTFIGSSAGAYASGAYETVAIGSGAGGAAAAFVGGPSDRFATNAYRSVFLGKGAGAGATNANGNISIGYQSGVRSINASSSVFLGYEAGATASFAGFSNFLGYRAGYNNYNAEYSNFIGYNVANNGGSLLGRNNTIIGTNITLPAGYSNYANIGGVIFVSGTYSTVTGNPSQTISNGNVGINVVNPTQAMLEVGGNVYATSFTGSLSGTASWATNAVSASYASNGGVTQIVAGTNITISPTNGTGSVTINAAAGAAFPFTGSALITGSLIITGSLNVTGGITGSLFGTSSWATNALTASFVPTSSLVGNFFAQGGNSFGTTALIGTNDNQSLAFETNGSVRMNISSSGFVGIGTTSPFTNAIELLSVQGSIVAHNTNSTDRYVLAGTNDLLGNWAFSGLRFDRANNVAKFGRYLNSAISEVGYIAINSIGNIGVGTITPSASLHILGTNTSDSYSLWVQNSSGETLISAQNNRTININATNATNGDTNIGTTNGIINFNRGYNNQLIGNALNFYSGGPASTIQGFNSAPGIAIGYAGTTVNPNPGTGLSVRGTTTTSGSAVLFVTGSSTTRLLALASETNPNTFVVSGSGNIGIGTATPSARLDVSGSSRFAGDMVISGSGLRPLAITSTASSVRLAINQTGGSTNTGISLSANDVSKWSLAHYIPTGTNTSFVFYNDQTNTNSLFINGDTNNVGIGTIIPNAKLDVSGSAIISGSLIVTQGITGSLSGTASWSQNSVSTSFAATASSADNFTVRGTLTAQTIVVQTITSSTDFITGSTKFGSTYGNTHTITGSVSINESGSNIPLTINGRNLTSSTNNKVLEVIGSAGTSVFSARSNGLVYVGTGQLYFEQNGLTARYYDSRLQFGTTSITTASANANPELYGGIKIFSWDGSTANPEVFRVQGDGKVGIGTTNPNARLDVSGSAIISGSLNVTQGITGSLSGTASWATNAVTASYANSVFDIGISELNSTSSATVAGTTIVSSIVTGSFSSAFYNYTISSGSNARAGQVISVWSGTTIRYTEVTTTDIGNTSTASFAVSISGNSVQLNFSAPGTWTVKSIANLL